MIQLIVSLIFCVLFFGCTPTNQTLTDLVGGETTSTKSTTVNGPLGNSALTFSPTSKDFGTLAANSGSSTQIFTVTNTSIYTIFLGTLSGATTHFTVTANTCTLGLQMAPNATCSITLQFAPLTTGNLSTSFTLPYDTTIGGTSFNTTLGVFGAGTTLTGFGGLTSISLVRMTDVTLNWTDAGVNAGSYQAYQITSSGAAILLSNLVRASVCGAGVCATTVNGLNPSTAYTFRIRATDTNGIQEQNIVNVATTTLAGNLDIAAVSSTTNAGICLPLTITTRDAGMVAANVTTNVAISISGLGNASLYSNAGCTVGITTVPITNGTNTTTFYLKDLVKENLTLISTLTTFASDTQSVTIDAAAADHLVAIGGSGLSTRVNQSLSTSAAIKVVDVYGNGVSGVSLSLFSMFESGGKAGTPTLTTDSNGLASTGVSVGSIGIKDTYVIQRIGTVLPDVAATGDARLFYTNTQTTTNSGIFLGINNLGAGTYGVVSADFNGDGKVDLATANYGGSNISILLGAGNGTFSVRVDYATCSGPVDIITNYFDGDANLDLAVSCYNTGKMGVHFGAGNGTFSAVTQYTSTAFSYGLTSADYDGINGKDIAVAGYSSSVISVYLNNGNGTFAAKVDYTVGTNPYFPTSVDVNGDGATDIVSANYGSNNISVLRNNNNGTGTFAAKVDYAAGGGAMSVEAGLLNGDAYFDLVVTNFTANTVSVLLGNAAGTFLPKTDYAAITSPNHPVIYDYNNDGKKDIVVSSQTDYLSTYLGNGDGTFGVKTDYFTGNSSMAIDVVCSDFNNDGYKDIAAATYTSASLVLLKGSGTTFKLPPRFITASTGLTFDATAADLNNDGKMDLITVNYNVNTMSVLMGQGSGSFAAKVEYATDVYPLDAITSDFNADGKLDIATVNKNSNSISIFIGVGDGTFAAGVSYTTGTGPYQLTTSDFNRDGKMDIAVANYTANTISILMGAGNGTFAAKVDYAAGTGVYGITVGDFNNDKIIDLATANYGANTVSVFIGIGNGTFAAKVDYAGASLLIKSGDMNGDNFQDLIVANYNGNCTGVLLNSGTGTFGASSCYSTGIQPYALEVGDYNGDGKLDALTGNYGSGNVSLSFGSGTGTLGIAQNYLLGSGRTQGIFSADIDADGKLDIIAPSLTTGLIILPGL